MEEKLDRLLKRQNILIGVIILLAGALMLCWNTVQGMNDRMNQMKQSMDQMENKTQREIQNGLNQMQNILDQQASMLADGRVTIGELVEKEDTVHAKVDLAVVPKQVAPGAVVTVRLLDDSFPNWSMTLPTELAEDGLTYTASAEIPLVDQLRVQMIVEKNGIKTVEYLPWYEPVQERFLLGVDISPSGSRSYGSGRYEWDETYYIHCYDKYYESQPDQYPESGKLSLIKNGKTVEEFPISFNGEEGGFQRNGEGQVELKTNLLAAENDTVEVAVEIQDNRGFTYRQVFPQGRGEEGQWYEMTVTYHGKDLTNELISIEE